VMDLAGGPRTAVCRIKRVARIHRATDVGIGRDLPAEKVDGVEHDTDHLHRLVAREGAERAHWFVPLQKLPQAKRATASQRMLDWKRSAEAADLLHRVGTLDSRESAGGCGNDFVKTCHGNSPAMRHVSG